MQEELNVASRFGRCPMYAVSTVAPNEGTGAISSVAISSTSDTLSTDNTHFDALGSDHNNAGFLGLAHPPAYRISGADQ